MNDLELIRAQLIGIRTQADAAIRAVTELMERVKEPEPEPEIPHRPRYLGETDPAA